MERRLFLQDIARGLVAENELVAVAHPMQASAIRVYDKENNLKYQIRDTIPGVGKIEPWGLASNDEHFFVLDIQNNSVQMFGKAYGVHQGEIVRGEQDVTGRLIRIAWDKAEAKLVVPHALTASSEITVSVFQARQ